MDKKATSNQMTELFDQAIAGFHQYLFSDPPRLAYVSQNLCERLGMSKEELLSGKEDRYGQMVHPADRGRYEQWIGQLGMREQTQELEYRLIKKDGSVLFVHDTITVRRQEDGMLAGYSVLADITSLKNEYHQLQFLKETMPCGCLKYTCEKQPRVTYLNEQMKEFLRFPKIAEGELDYLELFQENIFLMIPIEERRRFALYLNRVYTAGTPLAGELTVLRCDGTRAHLFGWMTKGVNEQGAEEFQSVCMDMTERHQVRRSNETERYLKALTDVYEKVFAYDLGSHTVKCLYSNHSPRFQWFEQITMQMEEATEKWIADTVIEEEREKVRSFFREFCEKRLCQEGEKPPQITYRAYSSDKRVRLYSGIFLQMDGAVSLYCCRRVPDAEEAELLRTENSSLRESLQELVQHFSDGIAAFEVVDQQVTPLYASDNVCEFFGLTTEEWLPLMKQSTPLEEFVARSRVAYGKFAELLQNGEAEFFYQDLKSETKRRIKAICSPKHPVGSSPRYVMLYRIEEGKGGSGGVPEKENAQGQAVTIRTFGYFDVFVGQRPIAFRNKKSKELFALLVDRRGGYVSSEEAIGFLWEDEPISSVTLARYRKVALRLKNILEEYGISDVVEAVDGKRRIVPERVECDLYEYLSGKEEYSQLFKGVYLTNYSWGENTLAELTGEMLY